MTLGIKLELNRSQRENYVFFCPEAPIHLSLTKPRGQAPRLSSSILIAIRHGRLIDVEGVVDLENGCLKQKVELPKIELPKEKEVSEDGVQIKEEEEEEKVEVEKQEAPKKKTTKAKKAKVTE